MKLTFLGAAHEVTGSCTLLEACGKKILIDCGMEQGADIYENCDIPCASSEIDELILTHAHIDHSGKIPLLNANGFRGNIHLTRATARLCEIMLMDSAHIQEFEAQWRNRKAKRAGGEIYEPLYTADDVQNTLKLFCPCDYGETVEIADGITATFSDAGHLLGSASVLISVTENGKTETVLFSGDLGNINRPLIRNPQQPDHADYVVIESTYGNRLHGEHPDYVSQLTQIIQETLDRGGNVVIPSFAIGRTQELLYIIRTIKEKGLVKGHNGFPVYVDSPLAVEATRIYSDESMTAYYDDETLRLLEKGVNPIKFDGLNLSVTSDDSKMINFDDTPKVILSASGMCEAGRIRHHLKHNLWRPESTILFVGYQSEGTLGRKLIDGADNVKLFGEEVQVRAKIEQMAGISGHADMQMMLDWLSSTTPKTVFINHGNDEVCDEFAETIERTLGYNAVAPYSGACYDLTLREVIDQGNNVKLDKKPRHTDDRVTMLFNRLISAGRRLMSVIEKNRGCSNKDIAKFTDAINSLCDKWER